MKKLAIFIAMCLYIQLAYAERRIVGDMNNDGVINVQDVILLQKTLLCESDKYLRVADVNNDKKIDREDVEKLSEIVLKESAIEYFEYIDGATIEDDPLSSEEKWD